jgi:hypothetical protein
MDEIDKRAQEIHTDGYSMSINEDPDLAMC